MSTNNKKENEIGKEELPDLDKQPEVTTLSEEDGDEGDDSGPNPGTPPPKPPIPPKP